jgi:myosin-5
LGVTLSEFKKWTIKKQIVTRSEKIVTTLNAAQATVVRDSVAKFVYACLFEWLVAIVNESLAGENGDAAERAEMFIGVLDIYGFEHFQKVIPIGVQWHFQLTSAFSEFFRAIQYQLCQ